MKKTISIVLSIAVFLVVFSNQACVHQHLAQNATFHYYDDLSQVKQQKKGRLLQNLATSTTANLRIFMDYTFLNTGSQTQKNIIKRVMNTTASYFYNIIKVPRLDKLVYPLDSSPQCGILTVPFSYSSVGVAADLGVLVTNQASTEQYMAKSLSCVLLKSNNRPIWAFTIWNNKFLEYDGVGFQKVMSIAIHEMIHILGYSSALYSKYPLGNPFRVTSTGVQYLTSPAILTQLTNYFGCSTPLGIILQDQDGTLNASHHERKVFGNQLMVAEGKIGSYLSRTTFALLASTGWYTVAYDYAQPAVWGRNKGCNFFNVDNCASPQFCSISEQIGCNYDVFGYGKCNVEPFSGSCKIYPYSLNSICTDENYELKSLTVPLLTQQRGGHTSRCFASNFRGTGIAPNQINFRCYKATCSSSKTSLYVLINQYIIVCSSLNAGVSIPAPSGMEGTLRCPSSYTSYCDTKKTCAYHCNKNGVCINGQCLCTGALTLTSSCIDVSLTTVQMDNTGGLTTSIIITKGQYLILKNSKKKGFQVSKSRKYKEFITQSLKIQTTQPKNILVQNRSIYSKCFQGTFFDKYFGECVKCTQIFGCQLCDENGCLACSGSDLNSNRKCSISSNI